MIRFGWRVATLLGGFAVVGMPASPVQAYEPAAPTAFEGAYQGLMAGATVGLATGYLFARSGGWHDEDWKTLGDGVGIGALAGSVVGLTLGIVDISQGRPGRTGYVMRDAGYGALLGMVLGGIAGGLGAMSSGKGEHVLLGSSIGVISGTFVGMGIGLVESSRRYSGTVAPVYYPDGRVGFVPALTGRF
jgi:hypothetical protein